MASSHPLSFRGHLEEISVEYYDAIYLMRSCEAFKGYVKATDSYFADTIKTATPDQLATESWKINQIKSQQIIIQNKIATYDTRLAIMQMLKKETAEPNMSKINAPVLLKCPHCKTAYALMIFTGMRLDDKDCDASVFEPHIKETATFVKSLGVPAFISSSGQDVTDSEARSWRMKIWPQQETPQYVNDYEFHDWLDPILYNHCEEAKRDPRLIQWQAQQNG